MAPERPGVRDERVVVMFDRAFADRINDHATRRYEGNRSLLVRVAVHDLLDREAPPSHQELDHPLLHDPNERAA